MIYLRIQNLLNGLYVQLEMLMKNMMKFYLFVKAPGGDEERFCAVCKKHHILVVPGSSFFCAGYVRIAYCVTYEQIQRSLPAFKAVMEEMRNSK